jgi:hypothetical protein
MQAGSSGTLIGWKSGQTTFVPLWDWMEGPWLRTQESVQNFGLYVWSGIRFSLYRVRADWGSLIIIIMIINIVMIIIKLTTHPNPFFLSHARFPSHHSSHKVTEQQNVLINQRYTATPKLCTQPCRNSEEERTDKYRHWNFFECEQAA